MAHQEAPHMGEVMKETIEVTTEGHQLVIATEDRQGATTFEEARREGASSTT